MDHAARNSRMYTNMGMRSKCESSSVRTLWDKQDCGIGKWKTVTNIQKPISIDALRLYMFETQ
eukprot:5605014-Amphidinium_carterae.1